MKFLKMTSWASYPSIDPNNHIVVTSAREIHIPSNKFVKIKLGLLLISLPENHIIKISNPQNSYKFLSEFWLPSCDELTLTIVTKHPYHIKIGEVLCHLHLLPIHHFLPGILLFTQRK